MKLPNYLGKTKTTQQAFAEKLGVTQGLVHQWLYGLTRITPAKAKAIEKVTAGAVKRHELRPDIWDAPRKG